MQTRRGVARNLLTLVGIFASVSVGCTEIDVRPADGTLWARRYVPFEQTWVRAETIPKAPQKTPRMVIWEVSRFPPEQEPSPEQLRSADDLTERCYRSALEHGWFDFQQGMRAGYQELDNDPYHYQNPDYILDDRSMDPERPEFLMYYNTREGRQLLGFMFYTRRPEEHGPQLGGNLTRWHFHVWRKPKCLVAGLISLGGAKDGVCERGVPMHRSPEMMHVWLIDHPKGPFATQMFLQPDLRKKLLEARALARPETVIRPPARGDRG